MLTEGVNAGMGSYYTTSPSEYFAEIFHEMMMNPDGEIVRNCPQSVEFVKMAMDMV